MRPSSCLERSSWMSAPSLLSVSASQRTRMIRAFSNVFGFRSRSRTGRPPQFVMLDWRASVTTGKAPLIFPSRFEREAEKGRNSTNPTKFHHGNPLAAVVAPWRETIIDAPPTRMIRAFSNGFGFRSRSRTGRPPQSVRLKNPTAARSGWDCSCAPCPC